MSLIHTKVATIPDDPGFEVGKDEWNDEHKFPGAGAGEVVFVDASGHAATDSAFKFDAATDTLKLGTVGGAAIWFRDSTIDPANPRLIIEQLAGNYQLRLRSEDDDGSGPVRLVGVGGWTDATDYNGWKLDFDGSFVRFDAFGFGGTQGEPDMHLGKTTIYIEMIGPFNSPSGLDTISFVVDNTANFVTLTPGGFFPDGAGSNTIDLGLDGLRWRTGYFGTSVVTPLLTADAVTFPDADPHVAGAGYWVTGVLTKSAG